MPTSARHVTLFLAGDVMTGRGVDQAMHHRCEPELREPYIDDARDYVRLAERRHGPIPTPVGAEHLWGDALGVLRRVQPDASIVNLETSITTSADFWPNKEVHYRMHPRNVGVLRAAGIRLCALANNHALDFGRVGLLETLASLREARIMCAGAGADLEAASRPQPMALAGGGTVWVVACGSESSGIPSAWAAGPSRAGLHVIDEGSLASADRVAASLRALKGPRDLAVVSIHWGSNWGHAIPTEQTAFARRLIEGGVDLVHGHSSHHLRAVEVHEAKLILHGAGDLITDYEGIGGHDELRGDLGAMHFATLRQGDGALMHLELVPTRMHRMGLRRASRPDAQWLRATLDAVSAPRGARFIEHAGELVWSAEPAPAAPAQQRGGDFDAAHP